MIHPLMPEIRFWRQAALGAHAVWLRAWPVLIIVCLLAGLTGCQRSEAEIRIGLIATLSGDYAELGQPMLKAAEMAVNEINEAGGLLVGDRRFEIVLIVKDDAGSPETAAGVAQQLISQEGVVAIVGPLLDSTAISAAQAAENAQIPMVSPTSTDPETTAGKRFVFRATYTNEFQGEVIARFAIEDLGAANDARGAAVVFDVANDYSRSIAERFKQIFDDAGVRISAYESYTTGETDFSQQLLPVSRGVNLVVLPNFPADVSMQVKQARSMGIFQTIVCSDALSAIDPADYPDLDRVFLTAAWHPAIQNQTSQQFAQSYRSAYGQEPTSVAALTYDSMQLIFRAIRAQASFDPLAIREGLATLGRYEGVTGAIEYQGSGDPVNKSVAILQIKDGRFVFFKMVSP